MFRVLSRLQVERTIPPQKREEPLATDFVIVTDRITDVDAANSPVEIEFETRNDDPVNAEAERYARPARKGGEYAN